MKYFALLIIISLCLPVYGQNYINGAESVAYHAPSNTYYVSSLLANRVVAIDSNGNQSLFRTGITAFGNCIKGDTLYLSSGASINGFDVTTGDIIFHVTVPEAQQFDGMTHDNAGNLYVVETASNRLIKININDSSYTWLVEQGLEPSTQDVIYDSLNSRILVCAWGQNTKILSVDPETGDITEITDSWGRFDGITIDENGFVYLGTYANNGQVLMYDSSFTIGPVTLFEGIPEPAGLDYNKENHMLAVPSFAGDSVMFLPVAEDYFYPLLKSDKTTGHLPLTIQFYDMTLSNQQPVGWEWDFNNDGTIDSYEQNPTYTYSDTGTYTVTLTVNGSYDSTVVMEDYIHVFNGESAIYFPEPQAGITLAAKPELNMTGQFTIEAYIYPEEWPSSLSGSTILDKNAVRLYYTGNAIGAIGDRTLIASVKLSSGKNIILTSPDDLLSLNQWHHVVMTFDAQSNKAFFYIDGAEYPAVPTGNDTLNGPLQDNSTEPLFLGNNSSANSLMQGKLDEIRIWNYARTRAELQQNSQQTLNGSESGLIACWDCNEGSGTVLLDKSPNGFNADIHQGVYRKGVDFGSVNDIEQNEAPKLPEDFSLHQNYPNPFNPETTIMYNISEQSLVSLTIYNILGSEVVSLVNEEQERGKYEVRWNGTDAEGNDVSSGIYFYTLTAAGKQLTLKMMLLR